MGAVPAGARPPGADELRSWLRARLPEPMVPSAFVAVSSLPLTAHGKLDRDALPPPGEPAPAGSAREARDVVEARLVELWRRALGIAAVGVADSFFALGGESLAAVALADAISRRFAVPFGVATLFLHPTVEEQAAWLRAAGQAVASQLILLEDGDGPATVVFLHHGGGTVLAYLELARRLRGLRVYGIQAEALATGRSTLTSVEAMAERYLALLDEAAPGGELVCAGWSSGGLIAFEMARRRAATGQGAPPVVLLDTYPPAEDGAAALAAVEGLADADLVYEMLQHPEWLDRERLRALAGDELLACCIAQARSQGALPPDYRLEQARAHLEAVRVNLLAAARYHPRPYDGEVMLCRAEGDAASGETLGWERLARGGVRRVPVSGSHSRMMSAANLDAFETAIRDAVARLPAAPAVEAGRP